MTALAIAQIAIQLLPLLETGTTEMINFINSVRSTASQTGEWTEAMEADFQAALLATTNKPEFKPDAA